MVAPGCSSAHSWPQLDVIPSFTHGMAQGAAGCPTSDSATSIPKLLQGASGRPQTQPMGRWAPQPSAFWTPAPPAWLHPKPGGQRNPKHSPRGTTPTPHRSESLSSQQGQTGQKSPRNEAWGHPALSGGKSRPRGVRRMGILLLGCSSSSRRACLAHSAFVMVPATGEIQHVLLILPHKSHQDFIKMLLIVPKVRT